MDQDAKGSTKDALANNGLFKEGIMSEKRVARVTDIIAASPTSFEDAVKVGFERATKTLRGVTGLRIIEQRVAVENDTVAEYRVRLEVIFILES